MARSEELYQDAVQAANNEQWDKATAFATIGLLGFMIGAAHGIEALAAATEYQ